MNKPLRRYNDYYLYCLELRIYNIIVKRNLQGEDKLKLTAKWYKWRNNKKFFHTIIEVIDQLLWDDELCHVD